MKVGNQTVTLVRRNSIGNGVSDETRQSGGEVLSRSSRLVILLYPWFSGQTVRDYPRLVVLPSVSGSSAFIRREATVGMVERTNESIVALHPASIDH